MVCNSKSPKAVDKKYVCNSNTSRWVLKDGKIGKALNKSKSPLMKMTVCHRRSKIELKAHQVNFAKKFIRSGVHGVLAVHSLGSGKTLTAITTSQCYLDKYPDDKIIVITPASLIKNFEQEMIKWGVQNIEKYEFFTFDSFKNKPTDCKNSLLIIDEAHNLRTRVEINDSDLKNIGKIKSKTKTSSTKKKSVGLKAAEIIHCAKKSRRVLMLSGTPIVNDLYDLENLMAMSYKRDPLTKTEFNKIVSNPYLSMEYFKCRISFFNAPKENFPTSQVHDIYFTMTPQYLKNYNFIETSELDKSGFGNHSKWSADNLHIFYSGLRQASNSLFLEDTGSPKVEWIIKKIKNSDPDDKFVVFSHFIESGSSLLSKKMDENKIKYRVISGSVNKTKRAEYVHDYNSGIIKVLFITKAGGEGLNLLETNSIILMEPSWNETVVKQVIGRAIRYNSHSNLSIEKQHVDIYKLYTIKPRENVVFNLLLDDYKLDNLLSIDLYLKKMSLVKQNKIDKFINYVKSLPTLETHSCSGQI